MLRPTSARGWLRTLACMKITATWRTAVLSGTWTGLGALLFQGFVVHGEIAKDVRFYYFFFGLIPFFWLPFFVFVVGAFERRFLKHMLESFGRILCWMGGT